MRKLGALVVGIVIALPALAGPASASHSWGTYHWGRTANPFTVRYGDNVDSRWDAHLLGAAADWSVSTVLDMSVVAGAATNIKRCNAAQGRVEVCNAKYGNNGWLGIAGISLSGGHIASGYTKLNDSYFDTPTYNTPDWRQFVTCQEIGHNVGLSHQDENFSNANLGSCMDYTNSPATNIKPNKHDYDQLAAIYGGHTDATNTTTATSKSSRSTISTVDGKGNGTIVHVLWVPDAG